MLAKILHNGLTTWYSEEFIAQTKKALALELHSGFVSYSGLKKQLDTTRWRNRLALDWVSSIVEPRSLLYGTKDVPTVQNARCEVKIYMGWWFKGARLLAHQTRHRVLKHNQASSGRSAISSGRSAIWLWQYMTKGTILLALKIWRSIRLCRKYCACPSLWIN